MLPALLLLLGAAVPRGADTLPDQNLLLPPVNFTVVVAGLARALLRWAPHPDQARQNVTVEYHVKIHGPQEDEYETRSTVSTCVAPLHQGLSASVRAIVRDQGRLQAASSWAFAELEAPPGPPGTAAVNLTCTTNTVAGEGTHAAPYQVSLRCAWRAGEAAPADTQYFLYYRFGLQTHECREYSRDSLQRNIECWFPRTSIHSKRRDRLAVLVNGSSRLTAIRPLDRLFALHAIDQVNPPRNITAEVQGARLSIEWQKPVSAFPSHCFDYEVQISDTRKAYVQTEKRTVNAFTSVIDNSSRYCVQARATVSTTCRAAGLWSSWSPPFCVAIYPGQQLPLQAQARGRPPAPPRPGSDAQKPSSEQLLMALPAVVCFTLLAFSLVCRGCHLWTRLFPPVPTPSSNLGDLLAMSYEKAGPQDAETVVISYVDEPAAETLEHTEF